VNRRERSVVRAGLALGVFLGLVGCRATAPAPQVETVGTLTAGPSTWTAPVHETTPPPTVEIAGPVDDDATDTVTTVSRADAGEQDAAPEVVSKGGGLTVGGAR
jgi:hypothetical protein